MALLEVPSPSYWSSVDSSDMVACADLSNLPLAPLFQPSDIILEDLQREHPVEDQANLSRWNMGAQYDWELNAAPQISKNTFGKAEAPATSHDPPTNYFGQTLVPVPYPEGLLTPSSCDLSNTGFVDLSNEHSSAARFEGRPKQQSQERVRIASENTARQYARSTMTKNLIRIYHDSMENALSCWLTEHNCPYSDSISGLIPYKERDEWAPSWSNRMCIRVCRLDRVSSKCGWALSAEEDKTAARALHLAIIAFASQWTQHAQKGTGLSIPAQAASDERSIRERVWNEARHALEQSSGIPSFRVAFANIIFSLTQKPLNERAGKRLDQLLENDRAPIFLDNANRQLFTFRHKFARIQRESLKKLRGGSALTDMVETPDLSPSSHINPIMTSHEHRGTLNLLHWLGVMFDTLSAAMYQRPLVVSDEDSQAALAPISNLDTADHINFEFQTILQSQSGQSDVWGDLFLRGSGEFLWSDHTQPRWPCSYEQAASILSEATPVKVLLYRRITQLQTLIYRRASRDRLEEAIQSAMIVYQHWNCTYQRFFLDCVANHEMLPPRIQSWYVILDGHWHLATMLLADVIESIDEGRLGSDVEREARQGADFVATLRIDNALAVGALARSSLQGQIPTLHGHFHDALNEVAFLVEPWTVVLIHSFAKAAYVCLDSSSLMSSSSLSTDCFRQNCESCICALEFLGRKSDMAFLVAQSLSNDLNFKAS